MMRAKRAPRAGGMGHEQACEFAGGTWTKSGKIKQQQKNKMKTWLKKHWAEAGFIIAVIASFYFILKGAGYFG